MSTDVRMVESSEHAAWMDRLARGFFNHFASGASDYELSVNGPDRSLGAFDGTAVVGTLRSFATELTTPGPTSVAASALTAVTVAPTHRRRGLLSEMITKDLRDSAERGEAVSVLLASEYPIYGRFGYGMSTEHAKYEISTVGLRVPRAQRGDGRARRPPGAPRARPPGLRAVPSRAAWLDRPRRRVVGQGAPTGRGPGRRAPQGVPGRLPVRRRRRGGIRPVRRQVRARGVPTGWRPHGRRAGRHLAARVPGPVGVLHQHRPADDDDRVEPVDRRGPPAPRRTTRERSSS